ncbi:MAG: hypothetical protein AAF529_16585 [Pseudomonadota bacterium]
MSDSLHNKEDYHILQPYNKWGMRIGGVLVAIPFIWMSDFLELPE